MIGIPQADNGQKVDEFEPIYSVITEIDEKWFVIFEHTNTIFLLVMFIYPNLKTIFRLFFSYPTFFFVRFLPMLSSFKPLNAQYSNF